MNTKSILLPLVCAVLTACDSAGPTPKSLSSSDEKAIVSLRTALVEAIKAGDAAKYATLCMEDVQLLHPNSPIVAGRAELQKHNAEIFKQVKVLNLELTPVVVSGAGDIAYEVGTQKLAITPAIPGFRSTRKYTHVLRRDADGIWKFAVLMSNDSE